MILRLIFLQSLLIGALFAGSLPSTKIHHKLRAKILGTGGAPSNIIVTFDGAQATIDKVNGMVFPSRCTKIETLREELMSLHEASIGDAVDLLTLHGVTFTSYWVSNVVSATQSPPELTSALGDLPGVLEIHEEIQFPGSTVFTDPSNSSNAWGVNRIEAPAVWKEGVRGAGVVVGISDVGVRYTHEAIAARYRTEFGWYDPYTFSVTPYDVGDHGTFVTGAVLGTMPDGNVIGVAPDAKWIACLACNSDNLCLESQTIACGQWFLCPTLADNPQEFNCCLAPDIVNNSWEGDEITDVNHYYDTVVNAWLAASIVPVFSAGNSGPKCSTWVTPGNNPKVIAVGATGDKDDKIAWFSSRGPTDFGIFPEISAPGVDITSADNSSDSSYVTYSGTSAAAPYVAGAVALLLSYNPGLTYAQIKTLLYDNVDRPIDTTTPACGGVSNSQFPNNVYGIGRMNVFRSYVSAKSKTST